MDLGKIIRAIVALALTVGVIFLVVKLISGAFALLGGVLDTILGIVLILALVAIVIWMFRYAAKKKK